MYEPPPLLHEAGHAFGLGDVLDVPNLDYTLMESTRAQIYCGLFPRDIIAMIAIYQSHTTGQTPPLEGP